MIVLSNNRALQTDDPVAFLRALMRDPKIPLRHRFEAARELLDAESDDSEGRLGKKTLAAERAARASEGRYAPGKPPTNMN